MNVDDLDLNLLRVFNQLMVDRSVSRVAQSLGVTQPTVSNALRRLRTLLGDELFLRTAQGMQPTPLAEHLAEPIAHAIDTIRSAVNQQLEFDPSEFRRTFVIGLSDLGEIYFLPALIQRISQDAPGARLIAVRGEGSNLKEDMEIGRTDIAIGMWPQLQGSFFRQRLFEERQVLVYRKDHPIASHEPANGAGWTHYEHLSIDAQGSAQEAMDRAVKDHQPPLRVRVTVPHFHAAANILRSTDLLATLPSHLAELLKESAGLSIQAHPLDLPAHCHELFWHARLHRDPANRWLRRLIYSLFAERASGG